MGRTVRAGVSAAEQTPSPVAALTRRRRWKRSSWDRIDAGLGDDPHVAGLAEELTILAGRAFTARLEAPPALPRLTGVERLVHPAVGESRLAYETLELPVADGQRLVRVPPGRRPHVRRARPPHRTSARHPAHGGRLTVDGPDPGGGMARKIVIELPDGTRPVLEQVLTCGA